MDCLYCIYDPRKYPESDLVDLKLSCLRSHVQPDNAKNNIYGKLSEWNFRKWKNLRKEHQTGKNNRDPVNCIWEKLI